MVAASVAIVALFAIQIGLRKEVEHDPDEQEWMRRASAVATMGDEIERYQTTGARS
jgi:hypothetical protein